MRSTHESVATVITVSVRTPIAMAITLTAKKSNGRSRCPEAATSTCRTLAPVTR